MFLGVSPRGLLGEASVSAPRGANGSGDRCFFAAPGIGKILGHPDPGRPPGYLRSGGLGGPEAGRAGDPTRPRHFLRFLLPREAPRANLDISRVFVHFVMIWGRSGGPVENCFVLRTSGRNACRRKGRGAGESEEWTSVAIMDQAAPLKMARSREFVGEEVEAVGASFLCTLFSSSHPVPYILSPSTAFLCGRFFYVSG